MLPREAKLNLPFIWRSGSGRPQPDAVVVKAAASAGGGLVSARQRVDSIAIFKRIIGPQAFADENAAALAGTGFCVNNHNSAGTAQFHFVATGDSKLAQVLGVDQNSGSTLALAR